MLKQAFAAGYRAALLKFALDPPTQVDAFVDSVEQGKDVPQDPATLARSRPQPLTRPTLWAFPRLKQRASSSGAL